MGERERGLERDGPPFMLQPPFPLAGHDQPHAQEVLGDRSSRREGGPALCFGDGVAEAPGDPEQLRVPIVRDRVLGVERDSAAKRALGPVPIPVAVHHRQPQRGVRLGEHGVQRDRPPSRRLCPRVGLGARNRRDAVQRPQDIAIGQTGPCTGERGVGVRSGREVLGGARETVPRALVPVEPAEQVGLGSLVGASRSASRSGPKGATFSAVVTCSAMLACTAKISPGARLAVYRSDQRWVSSETRMSWGVTRTCPLPLAERSVRTVPSSTYCTPSSAPISRSVLLVPLY